MGRSGYDTSFLWSAEDTETPYSICSADTPEIEEDHPLFHLKDSFLRVVMAAYQTRGPQWEESAQALDNIEPSIELVDHDHDLGEDDRPRKRGRMSDCASTITTEKRSQRAPNKRRAQDRRLGLACPYAKKDPVQYRSCYRYFLNRIRDVKQHLSRCHRKPIYCPICNEIFDDEDERDSHITRKTCKPRPSIVIEGISEKQKRELSQRVSSKMPEEQQWFTVFDTLFSPHPRPRTPYHDRELSVDLCVFQDFMTARGPTLLAEFLEARGVTTSNLPHEEGDLSTFKKEALTEGLQLIIEQWTSDNAMAMGAISAPHSLRSSPTVDSGIALQFGSSTQTAGEGRHIDNQPRGALVTPSTDSDRHDHDGNHDTAGIFDQTGSLGKEAGTFQAENGFNSNFQSVMDSTIKSSGDVTMDSSQKDALGVLDPVNLSQFTGLEHDESIGFIALTEGSDLFGLGLDWPP